MQASPHCAVPLAAQEQEPAEQTNNPAHTFPQVPQLYESYCRLRQVFPQRLSPVPQEQALLLQEPPVPQKFPQAPQLLTSVAVLTQAVG
jgi:hypothetical protein